MKQVSKIINEIDLSNAFKVLINEIDLSNAFKVRGHFRLQPYGEGRKDRKLIWINEFEKSGLDVKNVKVLKGKAKKRESKKFWDAMKKISGNENE